jgi:hypothetical protein
MKDLSWPRTTRPDQLEQLGGQLLAPPDALSVWEHPYRVSEHALSTPGTVTTWPPLLSKHTLRLLRYLRIAA